MSQDDDALDALARTRPLLAGAVLRPSGETAVAVEFGDRIDWTFQSRALALAGALDAAAPAGLVEAVPTYRSVLVEFDPRVTDAASVLSAVPEDGADVMSGLGDSSREWSVPVCVDGGMAEDVDEAATRLGLARDEVLSRLLASVVRVGMYGFAPGFAYLKGLDPALEIPRRQSPRPPMPAGSVIIANGQAAIAPQPMPTGWYVLGRTPIRMFHPQNRGPAMVPFTVGDRLYFRGVDLAEFERLAGREDGGLREIGPA